MTAMNLAVSTPALLAATAVLALLLLLSRRRYTARSTPAVDPAWAKPAPGARRVTQLFVYPVKSMKGIPVSELHIDGTGAVADRRWMVVAGATGRFVTQRQQPRMCLIQPGITSTGLALSAPGVPPINVPLVGRGQGSILVTATVWGTEVPGAVDQGDAVAAWLNAFLGVTGLRLVHFNEDCERKVGPKHFVEGIPNDVTFVDGFPFLVTSEASLRELNKLLPQPVPMNRFRPNIVVDGIEAWEEDSWKRFTVGGVQMHGMRRCTRCPIPTTDQETAEVSSGEPNKTLMVCHGKLGVAYFGNISRVAPVSPGSGGGGASPVSPTTAEEPWGSTDKTATSLTDYLDAHHMPFLLQDATSILMQWPDEEACDSAAARRHFFQYFDSVHKGTHVTSREVEYIGRTPWNRLCFSRAVLRAGLTAAVEQMGTELATSEATHNLLTLLCPDFPRALCDAVATVIGDAPKSPLLHAVLTGTLTSDVLYLCAEAALLGARGDPLPDPSLGFGVVPEAPVSLLTELLSMPGVLDVPVPVEATAYLTAACGAADPGPAGPRSTVVAWQRARTYPPGAVVAAFCTGATIRAGVAAVLSQVSATAVVSSVPGFSA